MCFLSQLNGSADLETLAASAQMLTSQPENLTAEEVTTAAQIADTLLSSENVSQVRNNKPTEKQLKLQ